MTERARSPHRAFTDLLTRLVRVPKHEIDEQERKYQDERRQDEDRARAREIVPPASHRAGR